MKKIVSILVVGFISFSNLFGQQTPELEHYLVNPYFYNPAGAGTEGMNVYLDYHKQWADFNGAPETQVFTFDKAFKKNKYGLGFKLINDEINILGSTGGYLSYSYAVQIGKVQSLRFGVEAGFLQNRILFDKVIATDNDEALIFANNQNSTNFDGAAGLIYKIQKFTLGFAAQNLIPNSFRYQNSETSNELVYRNIQHYYLNGMYDFNLGESKWLLQPSFMVKGAKGLPFVIDGNLTAKYDNMHWMTLRYKHNIGYSIGAGGMIGNQVKIGYAYGISSNEISNHNTGTHEVILGITLFGGSGGSDSKISNKQLDRIEAQNNELLEKTDYLEKQNQTLKEELERQKEELKNKVFGLDQLKLDFEKELKEWKAEQLLNADGSSASGNENMSAADELGSVKLAENGEKYVVIGATRGFELAKKYQTVIQREYDLSTKIIQNTRKSWYLIYTKKVNTPEEAQEELKRVKKADTKNIYVGKPWVYETEK
jgi:type IX secretion system PorP/SprF family membrane protein